MQSMSDDDVAYSALLTELFSDTASTRNARVHSWIEHQYSFALSEQSDILSSRAPSPSPSSSIGAHRNSYLSAATPSYDTLFFPLPSYSTQDDLDFEERERLRALRFIVQEMARDKALPPSPTSPTSLRAEASSSHTMRSPSSSTCISGLSSVKSSLSSDDRPLQAIYPSFVRAQSEHQHDLNRAPADDSFPRRDSVLRREKGRPSLCMVSDDQDSVSAQPSPAISHFSRALSRDTSFTTPCASSSTSPTGVGFSISSCSPENIALPASPVDDHFPLREPARAAMGQVLERSPSSYQMSLLSSVTSLSKSSPKLDVLPAIPTSNSPSVPDQTADRALNLASRSQSRWSATTATGPTSPRAPSPSNAFLKSTTSAVKNDKDLKTNKRRKRFMSLISRFAQGRSNGASTPTSSQTGDEAESDAASNSIKHKKSLSKKSSLASLRASLSLSRASFSPSRPPVCSNDEVPPLPNSPTTMLGDYITPPVPKPTLWKVPSRANMDVTLISPAPRSASTLTTFQGLSQLSIPDTSVSRPGSGLSLASPDTPNRSRISLLPTTNKRTSQVSVVDVEVVASADPVPSSKTIALSKSLFRLATKPMSLKTSSAPSRPSVDSTSLSSPISTRSRVPPNIFAPPSKLATVIATQTMQAPWPETPLVEASDVTSEGSRIHYDDGEDTGGDLSLAPASRLSMSAAAMCCPRCNCQWFPERTVTSYT